MLYREIIAVRSEIHKKPKNSVWAERRVRSFVSWFFNFKPASIRSNDGP
jgi:hypothetical protein